MATVEYSTVNDSTREGIESFIAELTVPPEMQAMGIVPGMPDRATVNIIDDEGKYIQNSVGTHTDYIELILSY